MPEQRLTMALDFSCMEKEQGCYKEFILWSLSKGDVDDSEKVSATISPLLHVIMLAKYVPIILDFNW